jgi:hypothetical protein
MNAHRDDDSLEATADPPLDAATGIFDTSSQAFSARALGQRLAERYRIVRLLGQGAMGSVYEAIDEQRSGLRVALKLLVEHQPNALYRLKNEFRALSETVHPNLVGLHGLGVDPLGWFIVMDLIDPSADFLSHVRDPAREGFHEGRLRAALLQLVRGISALHAAGKLHRDLKPRNVLVTAEGRVVIVDFGLVGELEQAGTDALHERLFAGTPAYAAPEQMLGEALGPRADLYAVGVMLYQALTGNLPVADNSAGRLLMHKLHAVPPSARALVPGVPDDLDRLCSALLQPEPSRRPEARQLLEQLGEQSQSPPEAASSLPFVARERELLLLEELAARAQAAPRVVIVSGPSGIGKTALIARFLERAGRHPEALCLRGRCHPHEQLPFKGFDILVDELGRLLLRMPPVEAASLMPRDIGLLSRLFPTLSRVPVVNLLPADQRTDLDQAVLRARAFAALKELFARLADRRPLLLAFDDLQWSDGDSAELFRELLRGPDAPACMFLCVFRESQPGENPFAEALRTLPASIDLRLEALDARAAEELAGGLLGDAYAPADLQMVVSDAAGSPFLLKELARHARACGHAADLRAAVAARIAQLDADAKRLLELVCIAGQPLELGVALAAAKVEPRALPAVLASTLLRTSLKHGREQLEWSHDRIRETVVAELAASHRAQLHGELAHEFAHGHAPDPDLIARHYHAAGQPVLAASYAVVAAEQARRVLAFSHAAELYELAIEHVEAEHKLELELELAEVYTNVGRLRDATDRYERVFERSASAEQRLELGGRAMLLQLLQGNIARGARLLEVLCKQVGLPAPLHRPWLAKLALMLLYLRHKLGRSVASMPVPSESLHSALSRQRLELCMRAARGLAHSSFEQAAYFAFRAVLIIRQRRDPAYWPWAIACEVASRSIFRGIATERDEREMAAAIALAERQADAELLAVLLAGEGARRIYTGQFSRAVESLERAEQVLAERGRSVAPVSNWVRSGLYAAWITTGHLHRVLACSDAWLAEARALGDRWGEQIARLMGSYRFLALDQPHLMREAVLDLTAAAGREAPPFGAHPAWTLEPVLYLDQAEGALAMYQAARRGPTFRWARALVAFDRVGCAHLWIRVCLAAALATPGLRAERLRLVEREIVRLQRERFIIAPAIVAQARAGLAIQRGDAGGALQQLETAAQGYAAAGLELYAAAARERAGKLLQGDQGEKLVAEARSSASALGVRNPERMFRALVTGFPD